MFAIENLPMAEINTVTASAVAEFATDARIDNRCPAFPLLWVKKFGKWFAVKVIELTPYSTRRCATVEELLSSKFWPGLPKSQATGLTPSSQRMAHDHLYYMENVRPYVRLITHTFTPEGNHEISASVTMADGTFETVVGRTRVNKGQYLWVFEKTHGDRLFPAPTVDVILDVARRQAAGNFYTPASTTQEVVITVPADAQEQPTLTTPATMSQVKTLIRQARAKGYIIERGTDNGRVPLSPGEWLTVNYIVPRGDEVNDLAKVADVQPHVLRKFLDGQTKPSKKTDAALCAYYGLRPGSLMSHAVIYEMFGDTEHLQHRRETKQRMAKKHDQE